MKVVDSLREKIGLRSNDERFARDAYLLTSILESRRADGRIDILMARTNEAGDPRRPSRPGDRSARRLAGS